MLVDLNRSAADGGSGCLVSGTASSGCCGCCCGWSAACVRCCCSLDVDLSEQLRPRQRAEPLADASAALPAPWQGRKEQQEAAAAAAARRPAKGAYPRMPPRRAEAQRWERTNRSFTRRVRPHKVSRLKSVDAVPPQTWQMDILSPDVSALGAHQQVLHPQGAPRHRTVIL